MEEDRTTEPQATPLGSLRAMAATFVELVNTRIELALVELREEGERRKAMLVHAAVAGVFLTLGLLLLAFLVVVIFWDTYRLAAIVGVTVLYFAIGFGALSKFKGATRNNPPPFEATMKELARDVEALRGQPAEDEK